jgi:Zn-dependent protease
MFAIILGAILRFSPVTDSGIWPGVSFLLVLQISAVLFNLIPLPPFDGYNAVEPFLPPAIRTQVDRFRDMAIWMVLLAFWFVPAIGSFFWGTVFIFSTVLGVDWDIAVDGLRRFRFWEL